MRSDSAPRIRRHTWLFRLWLITLLLFEACVQQTAQLQSLPADADFSQDYVLGPEDVVEVSVWKNPDLSREVTVRPDGKISLPLIGDVQAAEGTAAQLTERITEKLRAYYKEAAQVSVVVQQVNSYAIYTLGQVRNPGRYVLRTGTTFLQAVALSGGFTEFALTRKIILRRRMDSGEEAAILLRYRDIVIGRQQNVVLKPGDTIIVP